MSVVSDAIRNNSDLVFYTLKTPPPPRICYEVTNRFASEPRRKGIRIIDEELDDFINQNPSICRFETWMLNNGSLIKAQTSEYLVNGRLPDKTWYLMKNESRLLENL